MKITITKISLRLSIIPLFTLMLSACGSDDSGGSSSSESFAIDGGGTKGPMAHSDVMAYAFDGSNDDFQGRSLQKKMGRTNDAAALTDLSLTADDKDETPIILTVSGNDDTIDLTTGLTPQVPVDITALRTVITAETFALVKDGDQPMYATPLTTVAVKLAIERAGQNASAAAFETALQNAAGDVVEAFGFGMTSAIDIFLAAPLVNSHTTGLAKQAAVAEYRTAIESLGAIVQELYTTAKANNPQSVVTSDQILMALGVDLADGILNGLNGATPIAALQDIPDIASVLAVDLAQLHVPGREDVPLADVERLLVEELAVTGVTGVDVSYLQDVIDVVPTNSMLAFLVDGEARIVSDGESSGGSDGDSASDSSSDSSDTLSVTSSSETTGSGGSPSQPSTVSQTETADPVADNSTVYESSSGETTGSDDSPSQSSTASQSETADPVENEDSAVVAANDALAVNGGGVKGPMLYASVKVYAFSGKVIDGNAATNAAAEFIGVDLNIDDKKHIPLTLTVEADEDTIDIMTGKTPLQPANITMLRTAITAASFASIEEHGQKIYATPLTTVAVKLADAMPGSGASAQAYDAALQAAGRVVVEKLGFGMSPSTDVFLAPPLINSETTGPEKLSAVVDYRTAVEALGAIVQKLYEAAKANKPLTDVTSDQILEALGIDLVDGLDRKNNGIVISALGDVLPDDFNSILAMDLSQLHVPGREDVPLTDIKTILLEEMLITGVTGIDVSYLQDDSTDKPRVVSAISTGNTKVLLTFNKPMEKASAEVSSHYSIVQANVNAEVGALVVRQAELVGVDGKAVELTTSPQNEVTYSVMVTNVRDRSGKQIDIVRTAKDFVPANSADFAGTPPTSTPRLVCLNASSSNLNGLSCETDADCGGDTGSCTFGSDFIDSDGDGISDNKEVRGYTIVITSSSGLIEEREVTSDPYNPDTDGDGVGDYDEIQYGANPRDADSDSDGLDDNLELNAIYSSPFKVDTDGDGLEDGLEFNTLQTSPIHADTDGDQLDDNVELFERYRNPRIADLPQLALLPGNHTIVLNEAFSYTDSTGEEVVVESSSSAQLGTGASVEVLEIDETVEEAIRSFTGNFTIRGGLSESENKTSGGFIWGEAQLGFDRQDNKITSTGTDITTTRETQRVLEESYGKGRLLSSSSEVTRDVQSATLNVELSLRNRGDIAFSVTDIEVTMLRVRPGTRELEPLATLVPNSGSDAVYHLGPFDGEIGPLLFSDEDFPVGMAEELMRNPAGIAFRIANYAITDEFGRQFSYINQQVKDVTAGLVIDYGFEGVERFQMAASGLKDLNSGETLGLFDAQGRPTGLPLTFLLESQLGWERNPTTTDAIIAGVDGVAQTAALGDDVQRVAVGTRGLGIGEVIIEAGPNGRLDSESDPDSSNAEAVTRGFDTSATCGTDAPVIFQGRKACSAASQCTCTLDNGCPEEVLVDAEPGNEGFANAQCDGPKIITRVGGYKNREGSFRWIALTDADLRTSSDIDSIIMKPGESFKLAFVQDLDEDGLFGREEFMAGTTDSPVNQEDNVAFGDTYRLPIVGEANACEFQVLPEFCGKEADQNVRIPLADSRDTDRDGMEDAVELELGWQVVANGQPRRQVYSSPALRDSDGDGLTDWQERDIRFSCGQQFYVAGENRQVDGSYSVGPLRQGEFAFSENTIVAYSVDYQNQRLLYKDSFNEALKPDEDVVPDDLESQLMKYDDIDDLLYINKIAPYCQPDVLDPATTDPDDYISLAVALDPQNADTDGDGIEDGVELMGYYVGGALVAAVDFANIDEGEEPVIFIAKGDDILLREFSTTIAVDDVILLPGPNGVLETEVIDSANSDLYKRDVDGLSENLLKERESQKIRSNPLDTDSDDDLLSDGAELALGTNPVLAGDVGDLKDSDGDGVFDIDESRGLEITVNGAPFHVRSNPANPDTDGDGLPDFVEFQVGSNPSNADTDGDGLSDYDEFSVGQFAQYAVYVDRFDNFVLDASVSMQYGTLINNRDSDDDGLTDGEEVAGFSVITLQNGVPAALFVQTNPLSDDTDADGLDDKYELEHKVEFHTERTNPVVADTDGDGVDDGKEDQNGRTDPLVPDRLVTVRYYELSLFSGAEVKSDWDWELRIQKPGTNAPGNVVNTDENYFAQGICSDCVQTKYPSPLSGFVVPDAEHKTYLTIPTQYHLAGFGDHASEEFLLTEDQYFSLNGIVLQTDIQDGKIVKFSCISQFNKNYSYDDVAAQGFINGEANLSEGTCKSTIRYSVQVSK